MRLNGTPVETFALNDTRHRYRIALPAAAQKPGDNRLRFVFAATASPADADPKSLDRRQLAAAFYSLVTGAAVGRVARGPAGARRAAAVRDDRGRRRAVARRSSARRRALRAAAAACGRAALHARARCRPRAPPPAPRRSASLLEDEAGGEREIWSRVIDGAAEAGGRAGGPAAREAGDIVRIGLPWARPDGRASPGAGRSRRGCSARRPATRSSRAALGRATTRAPTRCARPRRRERAVRDPRRRRAPGQFGAYGYPRDDDARDRPHGGRGRRLRARLHARGLHARRDVVGLDLAVPGPPPQRGLLLGAAAEGPPHAGRAALGAGHPHGAASSRTPWPGALFGFDRGFSEFQRGLPRRSAAAATCSAKVVPRLARAEPRPALLRLRPLPRAALPLRPRAALRHAFRARRADPEGRAPRLALLPGREPGPAGVQRRRSASTSCGSTTATSPSPTRRWARCGRRSRSEGLLETDGRDRRRRPRRGAARARLDRPQRAGLRAERCACR